MYNRHTEFEFDAEKERRNVKTHGINFETAKEVFFDPEAVALEDIKHSGMEKRWHAIGRISDGRVITVWFTYREERIRLIGAAEFRKGRKIYEENKRTRFFKNETS
ncbi:MAG: BrnT family toxin [Deltaproteobacteria bacterium]|nr:BrnT family toxin [Deltaproteobacteria bacterium]